MGHGTLDELVPFVAAEDQVARFDAQGLRHRFVRYPGEDHMAFATQDRFDSVLDGLGTQRRAANPERVAFSWFPNLDRPRLGLRATGAYWVTAVRARETAAGSLARVTARTFARRHPGHQVIRFGPTPVTSPLPAVLQGLRWKPGRVRTVDPTETRPLVTLRLENTAAVTVDLDRAGLQCGRVRVVSDGKASVRLVRDDRVVRRTPVPAGTTTIRLPC